jgi:hypothetical protein
MAYWPLLLIHISMATVGLLAGFMAMGLRKGSSLHGAAGTVFTVSMLIAAGAGAILAAFVRFNAGNVIGSTLTLYLVTTAWIAARRRDGKPAALDVAALLFAAGIVSLAATWGFQAASSATGRISGFDAPFFFVFGTVALLFAIGDVRMFLRGGFGTKRVARHLLRMSLGLFFATMSFYPGQAKIFPMWLRETNLLFVPHILLVGTMLFYLVRVRARRRVPALSAANAVTNVHVIAA